MGLREHHRAPQLDTWVACYCSVPSRVRLCGPLGKLQELLRNRMTYVPKSLGQPPRTGHWQPVPQRGRQFQCSREGSKRERNLRSKSSEIQKQWWAWTISQRLITSRIKTAPTVFGPWIIWLKIKFQGQKVILANLGHMSIFGQRGTRQYIWLFIKITQETSKLCTKITIPDDNT